MEAGYFIASPHCFGESGEGSSTAVEGERESRKGKIFVLQKVHCDLMSTSSVHLFFLPTYSSYGVLKNDAGGQLSGMG